MPAINKHFLELIYPHRSTISAIDLLSSSFCYLNKSKMGCEKKSINSQTKFFSISLWVSLVEVGGTVGPETKRSFSQNSRDSCLSLPTALCYQF